MRSSAAPFPASFALAFPCSTPPIHCLLPSGVPWASGRVGLRVGGQVKQAWRERRTSKRVSSRGKSATSIYMRARRARYAGPPIGGTSDQRRCCAQEAEREQESLKASFRHLHKACKGRTGPLLGAILPPTQRLSTQGSPPLIASSLCLRGPPSPTHVGPSRAHTLGRLLVVCRRELATTSPFPPWSVEERTAHTTPYRAPLFGDDLFHHRRAGLKCAACSCFYKETAKPPKFRPGPKPAGTDGEQPNSRAPNGSSAKASMPARPAGATSQGDITATESNTNDCAQAA